MRTRDGDSVRTRATCALALLAALAVLPAAQAQPEAFGVTPTSHTIPEAQAGQTYLRKVTIQNQMSTPSTITVERQGDVASWVTVSPATEFTIPARTNREVELSIRVPDAAGPGTRTGHVAFTTEPKTTGAGNPVRLSAATALNVTVGGQAVVALLFTAARAPDADTLNPPIGYANVTNAGNVAATARMGATVTALGQAEVLARGNGTVRLDPGASVEFPVYFTAKLPVGQYTMRFVSEDPTGFAADVEFKVALPGERPPRGTLQGLLHEAYGKPGTPLRIDGRFHNPGDVAIRSAQLKAEIRLGADLVAALESDALAVPPGATVNLTVYWTPGNAGTYLLSGHVVYDGYVTPDNESPLNVEAAAVQAFGVPWWVWAGLALFLVILVAVLLMLLRRRRAKDDKPKPPGRAPASSPPPGAGQTASRRASRTATPPAKPPAKRASEPSPGQGDAAPARRSRARQPPPADKPRDGPPSRPSPRPGRGGGKRP